MRMMLRQTNRYVLAMILLFVVCVKVCSQEQPTINHVLKEKKVETPLLSAPIITDSLQWQQNVKMNSMLNSYEPRQSVDEFSQSATVGSIASWQGGAIVGGSEYDTMLGLMERRQVDFNAVRHYGNFTIAVGISASKYAFPSDGRLGMLEMNAVQNQFGISGALTYDFNNHVSATVYGQYVSNPFFYSMAAFPYISTSSYGGFLTLHNGSTGLDLGVNNHYDPFIHSWRTDPIVRPVFKIGKVKAGIDFGPIVKDGILKIMGKQRQQGPIIMPDM